MSYPRSIDFAYIRSHCDRTKYQIPHYYDRQIWKRGETYRMRVSYIYDPSKFWIVLKESELDIFQKFITNFYTKNGTRYKLSLKNVARNMYCAAFTDNCYYRGLIVNIPHSLTVEKKAVVFLFDFGYVSVINLEDLYYLAEKFYEVPQFAVRASLSYLKPYNKDIWDSNVVNRFNELVAEKVLLCVLECTDPTRKMVVISVGSVNGLSNVTDIGDILMNEKLATNLAETKKDAENKNNSRYSHKTKFPYLFPSFEAIESGMMPSEVYTSELLRHCVATDVLFKPYFTYKGNLD